jgi:hypothetical protein
MTEAGDGKIEISRLPMYMARFRSYSVHLDGVRVGRIKEGETKTFSASPGVHKVWVKIDWVRSNPIQIDVLPNGTIHLLVGKSHNSRLKYWGSLVIGGILLALGGTLGGIFQFIFIIAAVLCAVHLWRPELSVLEGPISP